MIVMMIVHGYDCRDFEPYYRFGVEMLEIKMKKWKLMERLDRGKQAVDLELFVLQRHLHLHLAFQTNKKKKKK